MKKILTLIMFLIMFSFIFIGGMFLLCIIIITSPNKSNKFSYDESKSLIISDKGNFLKSLTIKMTNDSNCILYSIRLKDDSIPSSCIRLDSLIPNNYTLIMYDFHKGIEKGNIEKILIEPNSELTIHNGSYGDVGGYKVRLRTNAENIIWEVR